MNTDSKQKTRGLHTCLEPARLGGTAMLAATIMTLSVPTTAYAHAEANRQGTTQVSQDGQHRIAGTVTDDLGSALPGVTIEVKESGRKVITDAHGQFDMQISGREKTLIVSYLGMATQEVSVTGKSQLNIMLVPEENMLSGVVVTGYQTISKERATGAFDIVGPENLKGKLQTDIISRLEGKTAGMVQQNGSYFIRGIATLRGGAAGFRPLIVVDGLPFEGELESINPSTIKNVTILKDAAAASIYGARAANGVIVVSTIDGSESGKVTVRYDGSVKFTPKANMDELNLMSSADLVDLQQYGFQFQQSTYSTLNPRVGINPVFELLYKQREGLITDVELDAGLKHYAGLDNRAQLEDFYARTGVEHQHNVSLAGGNDRNRYALTLNYMGDTPNLRYQSSKRYGFTLRDNLKFFDWLKADLSVASSFTRSKGDSGMGSYLSSYTGYPSYYMFEDGEGNALNLLGNKSDYELERLRGIGLNDETYSPIKNRREQYYKNSNNYYRVQVGLNFKFTDYLNMDVKFQSENTTSKDETTYSRNSYHARNMVNDAAQYDAATGTLTLNVPQGGQFSQTRGDSHSYTLRAQLNFDKEFGKHYVTAIGGAERRQVKSTRTAAYYMGYDSNSLGFKPINALVFDPLEGTQSLGGSFTWVYTDHNYLYEREDRYVSFYANASYSYDYKYDFTASIRVDESNLFGTDPKYQYRPLWSAGGSWHLHKEKFLEAQSSWLDKLTLRLTYGIGGNVPKDAGPYLTLMAPKYNSDVNEFGSEIKNPPNPTLRWEKTTTVNLGIDFAVLHNRLSGSIDLYNKSTKDLLANRNADPTLGWAQVMLNYGKMYNRGVELSLNSRNIETPDFRWTTALNFSYNKNKLTDVEDANANVFDYTNGYASVKGYPMGGVFSYRYAGLSETGTPLYHVNGGEETSPYVTSTKDLEYSGTRIPKYTGSLSNTFSYKNFDLSLMFVYYGGHVFRGEAAQYLSMPPSTNLNRETLNLWRQPGDELNPNTTPAMTGYELYEEDDLHQWYAANKHVVKGDYIKLRDLSLTYNFERRLIAKAGLSALALTVQAQNLWTWKANDYGFDPEAMTTTDYGWGARALPVPTTWTIGISATF